MVELLPGVARALLFTHRKPSGLIDWFDTNTDALEHANSQVLFAMGKIQSIYIITIMTDEYGMFDSVLMVEQLWLDRRSESYRPSTEWVNEDDIQAWTEFIQGNWESVRDLDDFMK